MAPLASVSNQKEKVAIPNPKRKILLEKDDWTPSPPKFPYTPPFNPFTWGAEKIAQGVVDVVNFDISTPPESWYTDEYRSPHRAAYDDNIEIYHKAVEKQKEREKQAAIEKAERSVALAKKHLTDLENKKNTAASSSMPASSGAIRVGRRLMTSLVNG